MGWRPRDVYECTPQELEAAWEGWRRMNTVETSERFASADDHASMLEWYASKYG